jgi:hypothetical protein
MRAADQSQEGVTAATTSRTTGYDEWMEWEH